MNMLNMFIIQVIYSLCRYFPKYDSEKVKSCIKNQNATQKKSNLRISSLAGPKRFSNPVHV